MPPQVKVFIGSEEWTDSKINDFSQHLHQTRDKTGSTQPKEKESPNNRFKN